MNSRKRTVVGAMVIGSVAGVCHGTTFFSIDKVEDMLVTVNSVTGTVTPVGPIGYDFTLGLDLALLDGVLYALNLVDHDSQQAVLVAIDPATGAMLSFVEVLYQENGVYAEGLVSTDDELLASFGEPQISPRIGVLSPLDGQLSDVVDYTDCDCSPECDCSPDMDGLGYRASDQQLFSINSQAGGEDVTRLFTIDLVPALYVPVGEWDNPQPSDGAGDLAFSGSRLFALAHLAGDLFEIDPTNGRKLSMLEVSEPPVLEGLAVAVYCPWDLDGDGGVGIVDFQLLLANWGVCPDQQPCPADFVGNGTVDILDLLTLLANWGPCA